MTNLIYFGSPQFSANILESIIKDLASDVNVVGVVTNPDKPTGRSQILTPSPVAQVAEKYHLPVFKPTTLNAANLSHIKLLSPDIFLVAAYGKIIPESWLYAPKVSCLNIHFSLLPKYRGALCIQEALKNGDTKTGVTLMEMDDQLDHGPIIAVLEEPIDQNDNIATLQDKLAIKATILLKSSLPDYLSGDKAPTPQDDTKATHTPSLRTLNHQSAFIDWPTIQEAQEGINASQIHNLIRSLNPEPGAWTKMKDQEIKILATQLQQDKLVIDIVQKSGKNPITWQQLLSGL